ncbi:MAG: ABC transporter permease [Planctomycetia bacterium]|jgi:lipopolysaccharide transport system permease protein
MGTETVIRPSTGWFNVDLAGLWRYRDLLWLLVHRDFVSKYKQTVLGPLWFVIQPLLTTLVFAVVFGKIAHIPTDGAPPFLFYLTGLLGWNFFAGTFTATSNTLAGNAGIFGKVYFPRLVVPLATVISGFIAMAIQLATLLPIWAWYRFGSPGGAALHLSWTVLLLPIVLLQIAILSFGAGLWMSALTAKYRDFAFLSSFLVQLWMYATPVIYPFSAIPARWRWVAAINPMTVPVDVIKSMFLGHGAVAPAHALLSTAVTLAILFGGLAIFGKVERTFVDTV